LWAFIKENLKLNNLIKKNYYSKNKTTTKKINLENNKVWLPKIGWIKVCGSLNS
jgi:hypothetical protein